MKKIILIFLVTGFLYGNDTLFNNNNNRFYYVGIDYSFNTTNLIDHLIGVEFGGLSKISEEYSIFLGRNVKIKGEIAPKNKGYINRDFKEDGAFTQRLIYLSFGLKFSKYFKLTKNSSFIFGLGADLGYSEGQSIFFQNNSKEPLQANSYVLYNLYPEVGFITSIGKIKLEFFMNYMFSLNNIRPYKNSDNEYRLGIFGLGIRNIFL